METWSMPQDQGDHNGLPPTERWSAYMRLVLAALEDGKQERKELRREIGEIRECLAGFKVKVGLISALSAMVTASIVGAVIRLVIH